MALDTDRLWEAIDAERGNAYGGNEGLTAISEHRSKMLQAYLGDNINPAPEGRSQVVDRSVFETISTILPSLVRIFVSSTDQVCKVLPIGPDDEDAAEQTTAVLNYVAMQQNNWEQVVTDWIHDASLLCNGYAMAYWDQSDVRERERYEGQAEDQLAALLSDQDVEVIQHSSYVDKQATEEYRQAHDAATQQYQQMLGQYQQIAAQAMQQGQQPPQAPMAPPPFEEVKLHDVVIERKREAGKVCLSVLPPEHCIVSGSTPNWTLEECPYFEYRREVSISDLRAMGLEVADDISDDEDADDTQEDLSRDRFGEVDDDAMRYGSSRRVWSRMIWVRADAEGDGLTRLYYVLAVGRTILYQEPCARIPVASLTPQPLPHRHIGMSLAETVIDLQDVKTAVTRGGLDNLYLANNGRHSISSRVNLADMLDSRPGGVVRMLDDSLPGEGHILPLTHPFAFDQIIGSLEYFDQVRQNRSGASRYFSGTDANAINKTASGTMALQNMAAMRVEHIARMMAPAFEYLFSVMHELLSKHQNKTMTVKLRGKWTLIDPQAWRTKRDLRINVGVGAGNPDSMMGKLAQIYGAQMQLKEDGLAGPEQLYATVVEMAKLAGFSNPDKFWKQPQEGQQAQKAPPPEVMKAQIQVQAEAQKTQFLAQQEQLKFQAQQQLDAKRAEMDMQVERWKQEMQARQMTLEQENKAKLEALQAEYERQKDEQRMAFDRWQAELNAAVQLRIAEMKQPQPDERVTQVAEQVRAMMDFLTAPVELVKDQNGRTTGVKRGGITRIIQRGPDGRPVGLQ